MNAMELFDFETPSLNVKRQKLEKCQRHDTTIPSPKGDNIGKNHKCHEKKNPKHSKITEDKAKFWLKTAIKQTGKTDQNLPD